MDLNQLRIEIDSVDRQIVELYENRMDSVSQIADYKIETEKKFLTEKEKLPR